MKIVIVGAGNAGCFTALHYGFFTRYYTDIEIELIHNPDIPPEPVGQATLFNAPGMLGQTTGFDWYNNHINATPKTGILYEGWGRKDKWMHPFLPNQLAMHFCPWKVQESILNSGYFKVTESDVLDVDSIDADYVFDCRGKPDDFSDYDELINPTNACILGKPNWDTREALWSRHVTTPDGWAFVIPAHKDSPSHSGSVGYCYNSNITKKEVAEYNFLDIFDVDITKHINYTNYVAKNPIIDNRILLNGNRLFFLEPMESSAVEGYMYWSRLSFDSIVQQQSGIGIASLTISKYIKELQNFILWHYQMGSKYDTPFWDYAKSLTFEDENFDDMISKVKEDKHWDNPFQYLLSNEPHHYGQWQLYNFRNWYKGMISK